MRQVYRHLQDIPFQFPRPFNIKRLFIVQRLNSDRHGHRNVFRDEGGLFDEPSQVNILSGGEHAHLPRERYLLSVDLENLREFSLKLEGLGYIPVDGIPDGLFILGSLEDGLIMSACEDGKQFKEIPVGNIFLVGIPQKGTLVNARGQFFIAGWALILFSIDPQRYHSRLNPKRKALIMTFTASPIRNVDVMVETIATALSLRVARICSFIQGSFWVIVRND